MKLRSRILITVIVLLVVSTALLYALISSMLFQGVSDLEEQEARREARIVERVLDQDMEQIVKEARYYAQWDRTYDFAESREIEQHPSLTQQAMTENFGDAMVFYDTDGKPFFSVTENDAVQGLIDQHLDEIIEPGSDLVSTQRLAGRLSTKHGPFLVAVEPIVPTHQHAEPRGSIVVLQRIDGMALDQIAAQMPGSSIAVFNADYADNADDIKAAELVKKMDPASTYIDYASEDAITTYSVLNDALGNPTLTLKITSPRRIYEQNKSVQQSVIFTFLAFGVVFGLLAVWLIDRFVLQRLTVLSEQVDEVRTSEQADARVEVEGTDELSSLAQNINRLLDSVNQSKGEIAAQEARWRSLVESAPDDIFILERDGKIKFANHNTCGYQPSEIIGTNFIELLPEASQYVAKRAFEQAWDTAIPVDFEHEMLHRDRSRIWSASRISPIQRDGKTVGLIQITTDVTEQKQAELELRTAKQEAERANQLKTQFLANMSHDIRTPMTAIMGSAELLASDTKDQDHLHQNLSILKSSGQHLMQLIDDILDLAKVEAGELSIRRDKVAIAELVQDVCRNMRTLAVQKSLSLDVHFLSQVPRQIQSDEKRLKQILTNLISNAIKFTKEGGVSVDVSVDDDDWGHPKWLNISVKDTGIGIEQEDLEDIFNNFGQPNKQRDRRDANSGSGMGLAISKRLSQLLDSKITVVSTPGEGSTFTLKINLQPQVGLEMDNAPIIPVEVPDYSKNTSILNQLEHVSLQGANILVAEDSPDNQFVIRTYLEEASATVTIAENGKQAVDYVVKASADRNPYDLILMDMQMPIMDGYTSTTEIRRLGVKVPIIALTAFALEYDEQKCLDAGCSAYVSKPIDQATFFSTILEQLAIAAETQDM